VQDDLQAIEVLKECFEKIEAADFKGDQPEARDRLLREWNELSMQLLARDNVEVETIDQFIALVKAHISDKTDVVPVFSEKKRLLQKLNSGLPP
jgi:hypothetical protein